jgi:hypothetical protein
LSAGRRGRGGESCPGHGNWGRKIGTGANSSPPLTAEIIAGKNNVIDFKLD